MSERKIDGRDVVLSELSHAGVSDAQIAKKLQMSGPELKQAWSALLKHTKASTKSEAVEIVVARLILEAKKALDVEKAELALILATTSDEAVVIMDSNGIIRGVGKHSADLLGKNPEDLVGMPVDVLLAGRLHGAMETSKEMQRAELGEKVRSTRKHVRDDGTTFEAEHTLIAIVGRLGQVSGFARDICDITQRKIHELRIEELDASVAMLVGD
jgi:PAS domain S-box-containing protein